MFLDEAKINIKAGDGGNGAVSFFFLKNSYKKIANGGCGGIGGDVLFRASRSVNTLAAFKKKVHFKAEKGQPGLSNNKSGRNGSAIFIDVPVGTVLIEDDRVVADLYEEGMEYLAATGGSGGKGNSSFVSQARRFPGFAEKGERTESKWIKLELRLIADAAMVGFPNAGKSTLISRISAARPKIADYPFTTLTPNLGVVSVAEDTFVIADIPGIIEGAHSGVGLGDRFLRHVMRAEVLLILLDGYLLFDDRTGDELVRTFDILRKELRSYSNILYKKDYIIAVNKTDLFDQAEEFKDIKKILSKKSRKPVYFISAVSGRGLKDMIDGLYKKILKSREVSQLEERTTAEKGKYRTYSVLKAKDAEDKIEIMDNNGEYIVKNRRLEKMIAMTDLGNEEALSYLKYKLKKMKIGDRLKKMGIEEGSTVIIGDLVLELTD